MFEHFFSHYSMLPENHVGFTLYGRLHLTWLVGLFVAGVLVALYYKQLLIEQRRRFRKIMAVIMVSLEVIKDLIIASSGNFNASYLPFHLCGISLFVILIHAFSESKFWAEASYVICLPGALAALLFADWTVYPLMNFMHMHSFTIHAMIILYPVLLLVGREYQPSISYYPKVLLFVVSLAIPIFIFNKLFNTNFFFINWPSPGSPLVLFEQWLGNPGYLLPLTGLLLIVMAFMYLPFIFNRKQRVTLFSR